MVLLFALAAGAAWMAVNGVLTSETRLPMRQAWLGSHVSRQAQPSLFWLAITLYSSVAASALVLGALGVREGRRLRFW
jgi:hypothetical protein